MWTTLMGNLLIAMSSFKSERRFARAYMPRYREPRNVGARRRKRTNFGRRVACLAVRTVHLGR